MFHLTRFARIIAVGVTTLALALFTISFFLDAKYGVEVDVYFLKEPKVTSDAEVSRAIRDAIADSGYPHLGSFGAGITAGEEHFTMKYKLDWLQWDSLFVIDPIKHRIYSELRKQLGDFIPVEHPAPGGWLREIATYLLIFLSTFLWLFGMRRQH